MENQNKETNLVDEYNKYFISYINNYSTAEYQAEQFRVISLLKNVSTKESINSLVDQSDSNK